MSSFGKFILGTLLGGIIGAIIGILLAPRSGQETRELISDEFNSRCNASMDAVKEKAAEVKSIIKEQSEHLEEAGRRVVNKLADKVNHDKSVEVVES
ncbi:MAG: YtxH domain-containing protein [Cyanobacteria bacterium]|nr:YtxH domain-containing protein [Cyanobacteriota bacterium]